MENWITKVGFVTATAFKIESLSSVLIQIGFPVLTVTESKAGIQVRQDRFLESGPPDPKENETLWYMVAASSSSFYLYIWIQRTVPLNVLSVDVNGKVSVDKSIVLDSRNKSLAIDPSKPFKLNAGTSGVC